MRCDKCNNDMTLLLISYVCDYCEKKNENSTQSLRDGVAYIAVNENNDRWTTEGNVLNVKDHLTEQFVYTFQDAIDSMREKEKFLLNSFVIAMIFFSRDEIKEGYIDVKILEVFK